MKFADILRADAVKLDEERAKLVAEVDAIGTSVTAEERSATPIEDDRLSAIFRSGRGSQAINTKRAPVPGLLPKPEDVADVRSLSNSDARARAVSFLEKSRSFAKADHQAAVIDLIESHGSIGAAAARMALTTGTDLYTRAWMKHMSGNPYSMNDEERQALSRGFDGYTPEERAMTSGTGASGGFFVPVYIDPTMIITGAGSTNPYRHISTVKNIGPAFGGWYGATAAQVTAAWTAEGTVAPDNTPTVTQPNIPIWMAEASVTASFAAFEDVADLASDVAMLFVDAKNNLEATAFTTGSGSSQPKGVVTAVGAVAGSRVSPGTGGSISIGDPFLVQNALPERFANYDWNPDPNAGSIAWTCNIVVANKIRSLALAQNSANSLWTDLSANQPSKLSGAPLYRAGSMSSSLTTGQDVLLYGDFSRYYIIDRVGFSMEFIPNTFDQATGRPNASRAYIAHWRQGADVVDANAFRLLRL
jgi:HK97 family phage major capsid protein